MDPTIPGMTLNSLPPDILARLRLQQQQSLPDPALQQYVPRQMPPQMQQFTPPIRHHPSFDFFYPDPAYYT